MRVIIYTEDLDASRKVSVIATTNAFLPEGCTALATIEGEKGGHLDALEKITLENSGDQCCMGEIEALILEAHKAGREAGS